MTELTVISGKGGTGKTSIVASFAALAERAVLVDCDVDAADLHLVLAPRLLQRALFRSGHEALIRDEACALCGLCVDYCRFDAIREGTVERSEAGPQPDGRRSPNPAGRRLVVDPLACEGCGVCVHFCPQQAIDFPERTCGEWFISETRRGPLVHARLAPAEENSGKLVTLLRKEARRIAAEQEMELLIVDGSPGIGCPVIASITGAQFVLVVTEPTASGLHDLDRVLDLTAHFGIPAGVCINKYDINLQQTRKTEVRCRDRCAPVLGKIAYDRTVTDAQLAGHSVIEHGPSRVADQMRDLWQQLLAVAERAQEAPDTTGGWRGGARTPATGSEVRMRTDQRTSN